MRILQLLTPLALLLFAASYSRASNNYFMPGDAFFHVTVTEELLDSLEKRQPPYVWDYSLRDTFEMAFCGYAGYEKATVEIADKQFLANLRKVYDDVRRYNAKEIREIRRDDGTRVTEETNGLHLFFYRDDFDLDDYRIALRYNENWRSECFKFTSHARLCCFIDAAAAVEDDWRDGESVPGLNVQFPQGEIQLGQAVTKPIVIPGKAKAIVLRGSELLNYYQRKKGSHIYILDSEGATTRIAYDQRWLTEEEWNSIDLLDRL
ncbi:hypothetical protein LOC68_07350 [Blastopirellula sp. JC732]|uniref:Uncharacterized protein n=1 Tax=Blastopirellula sediminis TaxID=2894196 RepID=A0A9X1MK31_9BACT|nr:hypothetical protein [Blastopirellula sediminis]MCC9609017.1 hypothetical protein [Blastopirellula sediminis]MCC9628206.1 hypothetical protein [Blastopirellula sediminis]